MHKPGKPSMIPNVAWWKVGKEALAMSEWPTGDMIDVHNIKDLGGYEYNDNNFNQTWGSAHSPSHEQYEDWNDPYGKIWSVVAFERTDGDIVQTKRAIFTLDPKTKKREVVGEWSYADANLTICKGSYIIILVPGLF